MGFTLRIAEEEGMRRQREGYTRRGKKSGDFGYPSLVNSLETEIVAPNVHF
jgi:hypothetical protein